MELVIDLSILNSEVKEIDFLFGSGTIIFLLYIVLRVKLQFGKLYFEL